MQYTNGSPCGKNRKRSKHHNDDEDSGSRQKSTTISFHCEKDPTVTQPVFSFVGTDPDECNYMFDVRSQVACGGSAPAKQGVGPGAVFSIMGVIAILVYFLGGVFYQRNVAHARGWRQLPNYSMWAGIGSFIKVSSLQNCFHWPWRALFPKIKSVQDGKLPVIEVRPPSRRSPKWR